MSTLKPKRCAIYTRKSSEEGLEQEFNSLHAQREACEAYVKSQKHEGWQLIKTAYDDGGISGGTMERPALQQLLVDVRENKIDIIVVYKVDRLSRSLADFAKMVELFDAHAVSFISITQQFNTTTPMGRLTLNILLSFAQFEREVTGERIRDKIAASKAKGMWMGGVVPLGYDIIERKLSVNPQEAETVRYIFRQYMEVGCVRLLQEKIAEEGIRSKSRDSVKRPGNNVLSRGGLYNLLSNPVYIGQIRHKKSCHQGMHEPIIDQLLWEQAQRRLASQASGKSSDTRKTESSLLLGKLFDESGKCLTPSHANKKGKRYRYYISHGLNTKTTSQGWRLPAQEIEQAAVAAIREILNNQNVVTGALQEAGISTQHIPRVLQAIGRLQSDTDMLGLLTRVNLKSGSMQVILSMASVASQSIANLSTVTLIRDVPMQIRRRGVEMRLVIGGLAPTKVDPILVKALVRAHAWHEKWMSGASIMDIANRERAGKNYVRAVMKLAYLAPNIIETILAGRQPAELVADKLIKNARISLNWKEQVDGRLF